MPITKGIKDLIREARERITTLSLDEAEAKLDSPDTVFVDIRDVRELEREGLIPNAFHAPRGMLEFWVDPESPYHKPVFAEDKEFVLYCASAWRSSLATAALADMGLPRVSHIEGGFKAWKEAGLPVAEKAAKSDKA
ncbi:Rhodanese domain protein [Pusillimonas sp. T7-7]|uniref:rhodanese-like domain-containing protein n=1 Tax=Pusillimonas sp. (strain T7-7) TaxID=1007105 RepID=UPI0002084703|nr:rhodanese-like domain-containing protein [Pusillimonas sp. T7-7]AEC18682.1 Rhodanese domain protein [Pusillimonas sp. T7-7]